MNKVLEELKYNLKRAMTLEVKLKEKGDSWDWARESITAHKTVTRSIISMIPKLGKKADETTSEDIYNLLKKYIKNEKESQLYTSNHITASDAKGISPSDLKKLVKNKIEELGDLLTSPSINIAEEYLPKAPTEEDILNYIKKNIDLSELKNKMQAMGPIMKAFPGCDGNIVKNILLKKC